jgi:putative ABC transport system permease protein
VEDAIGTLMLRLHGIARPEDRDFAIYSQQEILKQITTVTGVFTALLGGIAAISLLVGGIGIMNIMLVSVTERTREIGVRKAVGATDADIRNQFLVEAVATTLVGGVAGIALGWGICLLASLAMPFKPIVTPASIVVSLLFSAAVGIFFGWYPARRAARLDPIEALRYE